MIYGSNTFNSLIKKINILCMHSFQEAIWDLGGIGYCRMRENRSQKLDIYSVFARFVS